MQLGRRHRARTLGLAAVAAGIFVLFLARVFVLGLPDQTQTCTSSPLFGNRSFAEVQQTYHWTMEQLVEERMRLYEGQTLLQCDAATMEGVIPIGMDAALLAVSLPEFQKRTSFTYADFEQLLTEFWRTYDCHLRTLKNTGGEQEQETTFSDMTTMNVDVIGMELARAREAYDRLLFAIRSSEQYLPLHASLRCLQRGAVDVRNAAALISDATQCLPLKLTEPSTTLLK